MFLFGGRYLAHETGGGFSLASDPDPMGKTMDVPRQTRSVQQLLTLSDRAATTTSEKHMHDKANLDFLSRSTCQGSGDPAERRAYG